MASKDTPDGDEPPVVPRPSRPTFLVVCRDDPAQSHLRGERLMGHLEHVERHWKRYVTAGPIREPGGERLVGSVFLVLADDLADAKALMEGDPYITCGRYASIDYKDFTYDAETTTVDTTPGSNATAAAASASRASASTTPTPTTRPAASAMGCIR